MEGEYEEGREGKKESKREGERDGGRQDKRCRGKGTRALRTISFFNVNPLIEQISFIL